jgi:hypothetical protein
VWSYDLVSSCGHYAGEVLNIDGITGGFNFQVILNIIIRIKSQSELKSHKYKGRIRNPSTNKKSLVTLTLTHVPLTLTLDHFQAAWATGWCAGEAMAQM